MKTCLLISYFNSGNIGDLAISSSFHKGLSAFFNVIDYDLNGKKPSHKSISNNTTKRSAIYRVLKKNCFKPFYRLYKKYSIRKRIKEQLGKIDFDIVVFGGGNLLFETSTDSNYLTNIEELCRFFKKRNKRFVFSCIGVGPFYSAKQKKRAIKLVEKSVYTSYRDNESYCLLNLPSVLKNNFVTVDPVLAGLSLLDHQSPKKDPYILVNFVDLSLFKNDFDQEQVKERIVKTIETISLVSKEDIVLFSSDASDYFLIYELEEILLKKGIEARISKPVDVTELIDLISNASFVFASRMHSLIFSFLLRKPFVAFAWSQKVSSFMSIVELDSRIVHYSDLPLYDISTFINESSTYDNSVLEKINNSFAFEIERWKELSK